VLFGLPPVIVPVCSTKGKASHFKSRFHKKQVVLGLLAVLGNVPDAALPAQLGSGLPQLMSGLVRVLLDLKEQQDEAAARGDSEEDDEGPVRAAWRVMGGDRGQFMGWVEAEMWGVLAVALAVCDKVTGSAGQDSCNLHALLGPGSQVVAKLV
jgi:hypothetical protein